MADVSVLEVLLYGEPIGTLTRVAGDRNLFAFNEAYIDNADRPVLGLVFKDQFGELITDHRTTQARLMPFFSNLLPEGRLRDYLAERAGANPEREFFLLWVLGRDLPGAVTVRSADGEAWPPDTGQALAIERFDRLSDGTAAHIEDFAQIFGIYPADKYKKASAANIARVIATESDDDDVREFVRRLTFNTLIGNADMHVKNWSVYYPDRRTARLAPAYDFVSTIAYSGLDDEEAALKFSRTKRFDAFGVDELEHLAGRAGLPAKMVVDTAKATVDAFRQVCGAEQKNLPLHRDVIAAIKRQLDRVPLSS